MMKKTKAFTKFMDTSSPSPFVAISAWAIGVAQKSKINILNVIKIFFLSCSNRVAC